jgi:hypothetical protein
VARAGACLSAPAPRIVGVRTRQVTSDSFSVAPGKLPEGDEADPVSDRPASVGDGARSDRARVMSVSGETDSVTSATDSDSGDADTDSCDADSVSRETGSDSGDLSSVSDEMGSVSSDLDLVRSDLEPFRSDLDPVSSDASLVSFDALASERGTHAESAVPGWCVTKRARPRAMRTWSTPVRTRSGSVCAQAVLMQARRKPHGPRTVML